MKKPIRIIPTADVGQDVYGLVKGLNNTEKAACHKALMKPGAKKPPLYQQLFELIAAHKVNKDEDAQQQLGINSSAQISNLKQYLGNVVLDTLVSLHRDETPTARLHNGLMQLQILLERSNIGLARKLYKKLWLIADEAGLYHFNLQLLYYRGRMTEQKSFRQYTAEADELAAQIATYGALLKTARDIQRLNDRLILVKAENPLRFSEQHRGAVNIIVDELSPLADEAAATPHLQIRYLTAHANAAYMLQDFERCKAAFVAALELMESMPSLCETESESFLSLANSCFYNEFAAGRPEAAAHFLQCFDALAATVADNEYFRKHWTLIRFNTALKIAHKTADYDEVARRLEEGSTVLAYATQVLSASDALSVINSICISLFVLNRLDEAEALLLEIKERNRSLEREDVFYFSLVFYLLILYEQKAWLRLDTATEAAYHMLYNRKKLRPFENELMRFLKTLPARRGRGNAPAAIRAFLERLEVYRTDPVQRLYFLYFNYYDWLQSKLAGLTYMEYKRKLLLEAAAPEAV